MEPIFLFKHSPIAHVSQAHILHAHITSSNLTDYAISVYSLKCRTLVKACGKVWTLLHHFAKRIQFNSHLQQGRTPPLACLTSRPLATLPNRTLAILRTLVYACSLRIPSAPCCPEMQGVLPIEKELPIRYVHVYSSLMYVLTCFVGVNMMTKRRPASERWTNSRASDLLMSSKAVSETKDEEDTFEEEDTFDDALIGGRKVGDFISKIELDEVGGEYMGPISEDDPLRDKKKALRKKSLFPEAMKKPLKRKIRRSMTTNDLDPRMDRYREYSASMSYITEAQACEWGVLLV